VQKKGSEYRESTVTRRYTARVWEKKVGPSPLAIKGGGDRSSKPKTLVHCFKLRKASTKGGISRRGPHLSAPLALPFKR